MDPQQDVESQDAFDLVPLAPPSFLPNAERTTADDHKVLWSQPKHEGRNYARFEEPLYDTLSTEIRPLRLEGADVIISLSNHPEDVLLIHSTILERSPYFKTGLSYRWSTSGKQISTESQVPAAETIVHKYGLVLDADREGYTLVGNSPPDEEPFCPTAEKVKEHLRRPWLEFHHPRHECQQRTVHKTVPFHRSTYCQSMPSDTSLVSPSPLCVSKAHQQAIRDHKILFAMLYQIDVNLDGFMDNDLVTCVANVAAYAEYYGLLPFVAKSLEHGLYHHHTDMDKHVLEQPIYWLALGYMLRSKPVFADALRHLAGGDWICSFAENNPDWQDVILLTYKKQLELARSISRTEHELYRVTLVTEYHGPKSIPIRFTFLSEEKGAKKIKSDEAKARYLARKTLADWLAENVTNPERVYKGPSRHAIYPKLLRLATSNDTSIFGYRASSRLSSIFNIGIGQSRRPPQQVIEMEMRRALKEVKEVLERHLFSQDRPPAQQEPREDGQVLGKNDKRQYYLTHMKIEREDLPWVSEDPWKPITPDFEITAASKDWLGKVGLGHLDAEMDYVSEGGRALCASPMSAACKERGRNVW